MDAVTYHREALKFAPEGHSFAKQRLHAVMGVAGETGEIADYIKKSIFYGKPIDRMHLIKELGDVAWYMNLVIEYVPRGWEAVLESAAKFNEPLAKDLSLDDLSEDQIILVISSLGLKINAAVMAAALLNIQFPDNLAEKMEGTREIAISLLNLAECMQAVIAFLDTSWEEVFDVNITKLSARFSNGKYEADKAINRDVAAEDAAIAGSAQQ